MNKTAKLLLSIAFVVVVVAGTVVLTAKTDKKDPGSTNQPDGSQSKDSQAAVHTISYDGTAFSPDNLTVASGTKVTFKNESDEEVEPSSDPHPAHTNNPELNAGSIAPGESKTLTVTTKGTWGIHNHLSKDQRGSITVE